ncbi:MAG: alpha/beta fold hydrolase [Ramlibacter sp.]|nr:alpha/beta fold hydrolase [Ramlibacter sp.]
MPSLPAALQGPVATVLLIIATLLATLLAALSAALAWGGPDPIAPLDSINEPFARADFSDVPPSRHYMARDGTRMAWLHYPATDATPQARRVVLVHGSSARARSMHVLARALAQAGFDVAALDMRGHGESGERGHASYIGQLEDDVEDFLRATPYAGPSTLVGFSSGGGFALRFAGGPRQALFDRYVLLAPYLHHNAPTHRGGGSGAGWVSVGLPRLVALTLLNKAGITDWNELPVLRFGLNDAARERLTASYDFTLYAGFRPHDDYQADIRNARQPLRIVAGRNDELFDASRYAEVFAEAGRAVPVTLVDGTGHIGLTLQPDAVQAVVRACTVPAP